jgi:hypothetical protein
MSDQKEYLGDSVYVDVDDFGAIILTTENGLTEPSNEIFLEYEVAKKLVDYIQKKYLIKKEI